MINQKFLSTIGKDGGKYITTTNATTPDAGKKFFAIQAITDTVINAVSGNINVASMSLGAGIVIYGEWTSVTLTSGSVIAYQVVA
jgi:hypothetical protein